MIQAVSYVYTKFLGRAKKSFGNELRLFSRCRFKSACLIAIIHINGKMEKSHL